MCFKVTEILGYQVPNSELKNDQTCFPEVIQYLKTPSESEWEQNYHSLQRRLKVQNDRLNVKRDAVVYNLH